MEEKNRLLILDPLDLFAAHHQTLLRDQGFELQIVDSLEKLKDQLIRQSPDLVFLVSESANQESFKLCCDWKQFPNTSSTPLIFIATGEWSTDQKIKALNSGADFVLPVPFGSPLLLATVRAVLRRRPQRPKDHHAKL